MKSAYELALERLDQQGIERPREEAFSDEMITEMENIRAKAEAKLAELEIYHKQALARAVEPGDSEKEVSEFQRDKERIEDKRHRDLEKVRQRSLE